MAETDDDYTYSVAWIDLLSTRPLAGPRGADAGRACAVLRPSGSAARQCARLRSGATLVTAPRSCPNGLVNKVSIRAFNELWFRKAPAIADGQLQTISAFFHPLDAVRDWNRMYGSTGLRAVPVRRAVRGRGRAAGDGRQDLRGRPGVVPRRAEAVRPGQPRPAVVSRCLVGPWRSTCRRRPRLVGLLDHLDQLVTCGRRPHLPRQGLAGHRRTPSPPCIATSRRSAPFGGASIPTASSSPTSPAARTLTAPEGTPHDRRPRLAPVSARARRHQRHRPGDRGDGGPDTAAACGSSSPPAHPPDAPRRPNGSSRSAAMWRCSTSTPATPPPHPAVIAAARAGGDIDVALVAFGVLGDPEAGLAGARQRRSSWPRSTTSARSAAGSRSPT